MRVVTITNNVVTSIKNVTNGYIIQNDEVESEKGELGQILQKDGTFINPEPVPNEPRITIEDKVVQLQQDNIILMDALATTFEELLNLQSQVATLQGGTV